MMYTMYSTYPVWLPPVPNDDYGWDHTQCPPIVVSWIFIESYLHLFLYFVQIPSLVGAGGYCSFFTDMDKKVFKGNDPLALLDAVTLHKVNTVNQLLPYLEKGEKVALLEWIRIEVSCIYVDQSFFYSF